MNIVKTHAEYNNKSDKTFVAICVISTKPTLTTEVVTEAVGFGSTSFLCNAITDGNQSAVASEHSHTLNSHSVLKQLTQHTTDNHITSVAITRQDKIRQW